MLKGLYRDTLYYGGVLFLSKAISIISIPIITHFFSPREFIIIDSLLVFQNFMIPFVFLGMDSALGRFYNEFEKQGRASEIISSSFFPGLVTATFISSLFAVVFPSLISHYYLKSTDSSEFVSWIAGGIILTYINSFALGMLKYQFRRAVYGLLAIFNPLLFTITVLLTGYFGHLTIKTYLISFTLLNLIFSIASFATIYPYLTLHLKKSEMYYLYRYGLPFSIVSLVGMSFSFAERTILNNYYLPVVAGNYAFTYRIVNLLAILNRSLQLSWGPFSMAHHKDPEAGYSFNRLLQQTSWILFIISLTLCVFNNQFINLLANDNYRQSKIFLPFLLSANSFLILSSISNLGINISKKTYLHILNYSMSLTMLLLSFFFLYKIMPLYSLPLSMLISYCTLYCTQSVTGNFVSPNLNFKWKLPLLLVLIQAFIGFFIIKFN